MDFFDLAGLKTACADRNFLYPTTDARPHRPQVRIEAPVGQVMSVRDVVAEHRLLAAIITNSGQVKSSKTTDLYNTKTVLDSKRFLTIFFDPKLKS